MEHNTYGWIALAPSLGPKGKEIELQIQSVNVEKAFTSQHIKNSRIA